MCVSCSGALRGAIGRFGELRVCGLSVVATTCTLVAVGRDGKALGRALLWSDVRAAEEATRVQQMVETDAGVLDVTCRCRCRRCCYCDSHVDRC